MGLKNKNIIIISPQSWKGIKLSKHHYSIELVKRKNKVFYVNPFTNKLSSRVLITEETNNLSIVDIEVPCPYWVKFHFKSFYRYLYYIQLKKLVNKIGRIDIVWDFTIDTILNDYKVFKSEINIFHPVDNNNHYAFGEKKNVDYTFSLAPIILDKLRVKGHSPIFINHGLSDSFVKNLSISKDLLPASKKSKIKVGYVGNLLISSLDCNTIKKIVNENSQAEFHFIGPYTIDKDQNVSLDQKRFITFLKEQTNVKLYGTLDTESLSDTILKFDAFFLCYDLSKDSNIGQNSHKILEYLSTGKVVISNYIKVYEKNKDLIIMANADNSNYCNLFFEVVNNLNYYNSDKLQASRKAYALMNTYNKHITFIEKILLKDKKI